MTKNEETLSVLKKWEKQGSYIEIVRGNIKDITEIRKLAY
jgi:hypothetical protein